MYKASAKQPGGAPPPPGGAGGEQGPKGKDDVVDAEFVDMDDKK
jgi:hypothetical protein